MIGPVASPGVMSAIGPEWSVGGMPGAEGAAKGGGGGFGSMLSDQIGALGELQTEAAKGAQALATGQATDPAAVVMSIERARLGMQLASTIRTKAVESIQDIFHTQV